ncbi:MAG: hypothetical protein ACK5AC_18870 [Planctomycetota bacterium]
MRIIPVAFARISWNRPWQLAWMMSLTAHGSALALLVTSVVFAPLPEASLITHIEIDGRWSVPENEDQLWSEVMVSSREQPRLPDPDASIASSFVQRRIAQSIDGGNRRSVAENEQMLGRLSQQLTESSSQENVDAMAQFLSSLAGERSPAPATTNGPPRPFDVNTAQIDRVRKEMDSQEQVHYIATLIDANGATKELELDAESGAQLYKTMKIIESNPLLERVYRKIVMGFLDQVLGKPTIE